MVVQHSPDTRQNDSVKDKWQSVIVQKACESGNLDIRGKYGANHPAK